MKKIEIENCDIFVEISYELEKIERVSADELTYNEFFNRFMLRNLPVIIKNTKITTSVSESWFHEDGKFNITALESVLGDFEVPVSKCSSKYFDSHEKTTMKFSDYVKYWKFERNPDNLLYLKDFHLKQEFPHLHYYQMAEYFASDWINEYSVDMNKDDYKFIYIGPKGSW
jgi:predicted secreted protein